MEKGNILVTGMTGLVGRKLFDIILDNYEHVVIVGRNYPEIYKENKRVSFIAHDFSNQKNEYNSLLKKIERVGFPIDTVILGHLVYERTDLMNVTSSALLENFQINVFSYLFFFRSFFLRFWNNHSNKKRKIIVLSSVSGQGLTARDYLHVYSAEKHVLSILFRYVSSYISNLNISTYVLNLSTFYENEEVEFSREEILKVIES